MRVLLTGIDGFVGSHFADLLISHPGVEVFGTILTREPHENLKAASGKVVVRQVDLTDGEAIHRWVMDVKPDHLVHLAGQAFVPAALADPRSTTMVNVIGGLNVLEAVRRMQDAGGGNTRVLVVSSAEVYGSVPAEQQPITEEALLDPRNPYAASKAAMDMIARSYRSSFGMDVLVVRPFNHIGPRQSPVFVCSDFARRFALIAAGKEPAVLCVGNLSARRDFTDVRDVVRAYWLLLRLNQSNWVFNVCSGIAREISEVVSKLRDLSGIDVKIVQDPARLRAHDNPLSVGSNAFLHESTGWLPRLPFDETLRDLYRYWEGQVRGIGIETSPESRSLAN